MPELPEVETIKKTLNQLVINKTIKEVHVYWTKIIKQPDDVQQFRVMLKNQEILQVHRRGKFLLFELDDYVLISHLRMEGKYSVQKKNEAVKKHTHVVFEFTDDEELRYNDVRKFGTMHLVKKGEELKKKPLNKLGPDPFDAKFTNDYFQDKLNKTARPIKNVLLDQTVVTGLGNIYVDETLFRANVHPLRKANGLSENEIKLIREKAITTLAEAVAHGGTTIRSYVNGQGEMGMFQQKLFVYGQENKPCQCCGKPIRKIKVGGRGTHVCTTCQVEESNL